MADNLTTALENLLLDHSLGKTSYTMPTTYLALFNTDPTEAGTGTEVKAAGTSGYSRQALGANMEAAAAGVTQNANPITFGPASDGTWAVVNYVAVMSASTAGTMLWYGPTTAKTVASGDSYQFAAGALDFSMS